MTSFQSTQAKSQSSLEPAVVTPASQDVNVDNNGRPEKTVRVFHLINGEHYSGAERVQDLLASSLPEYGYEIGFGITKPGIFDASRNSRQVPLFDCTMSSRIDFRSVAKVIAAVEQNGYSMIHAHTPRSLMVAVSVARKINIPVVYHVHSPVGRDSGRRVINWLNTQIERRNLKKTDAIICVSDSLKQYMQELGHPRQKLHVVPNGVPCPHRELPLRFEPGPQWTLGTVALFRPRKGTEILLQAIAELKKQKFDIGLHAVGSFESPAYQAEILQLAEKYRIADSINWTGFTTNAIAEFSEMDLFVLPSLYGEGLPMVVLEAMSSGIPVIASDVEGIPQAIRADIDGLLFEPGSSVDLANKIREMIEQVHSWQDMRQSALIRQRDEFSDDSMARGVADIYDQVLGS